MDLFHVNYFHMMWDVEYYLCYLYEKVLRIMVRCFITGVENTHVIANLFQLGYETQLNPGVENPHVIMGGRRRVDCFLKNIVVIGWGY